MYAILLAYNKINQLYDFIRLCFKHRFTMTKWSAKPIRRYLTITHLAAPILPETAI
jgi:hypothetical protein